VKVLDETLEIYGTEPIRRNGIIVGSLTSGAFGHTLGLPVGLGYITCETNADRASIETGLYEVEIAGVPVPVRISLKPFL
jgi:4-methylaminobutanoate oxidase (formaldehyde-forming)